MGKDDTTRARGRLVELRVGRAAMLEAASDNIEALICYAGVLVDELGVRSLVIVDTETKERVWPSET